MRLRVATIKAAAAALILLPAVLAWSQPAPAGDPSCLTEKCHRPMLNKKFVHGPVAVEDCEPCHVKIGEHKFKLAAKGEALCYQCHEKGHAKNVNCLSCHDPHGTDREFQLKPGVGGHCKR